MPGAEAYIIEALNWLGLHTDEGPRSGGDFGPYRQSERKEMYAQYAQQLVDSGWAYYAFDTGEDLAALRLDAEANKQKFVYNHTTRDALKNSLTLDAADSKRLVVARRTSFDSRCPMSPFDLMMLCAETSPSTGVVGRQNPDERRRDADLSSANIVDDHLMEITHGIRGRSGCPPCRCTFCSIEPLGGRLPSLRTCH